MLDLQKGHVDLLSPLSLLETVPSDTKPHRDNNGADGTIGDILTTHLSQIGRASCRERV